MLLLMILFSPLPTEDTVTPYVQGELVLHWVVSLLSAMHAEWPVHLILRSYFGAHVSRHCNSSSAEPHDLENDSRRVLNNST